MQQLFQQILREKLPRIGITEVKNMINPDAPLSFVLMIIITGTGLWFLGTQYEICAAMPERWLEGLISGMVLAICLAVLYHRRE